MTKPGISLTTGEVAAMLNCTARTIAKQCDAGILPYHRIGNHRRITLEDLMWYADSRGIPLKLNDALDPVIQRERMRIDPKSTLAIEAELAWRRTACFLYRHVLEEFVAAISRQRTDRLSCITAEQRVDLLAKARMIGIAEHEAERPFKEVRDADRGA